MWLLGLQTWEGVGRILSLWIIRREKEALILAVEEWSVMYLVSYGLYTINSILQTSTLSPSQARSSTVQWLNPQSPTTPSCSPAVTPPSPKLSPVPLSLPATVVDKPPERYVVFRWCRIWGWRAEGLDQPERVLVLPAWKRLPVSWTLWTFITLS